MVCTPDGDESPEAGKLTLTEDGSTEILVYSEPSGAGLNGHLYIGQASLKSDRCFRRKS